LPVQEQHQDDARDQFQERQRGAVGKPLDRSFEGRQIEGKPRQDLAALGAGEIARRQVLDMLKNALPDVRYQRSRELGVPSLVPDRDDRGEDAGHRQHRQDRDQRLEILLAQRVIDQVFQAERHEDVEQRLDHHTEADERQHFLVVLQEWANEAIDRRQRAGGLARGEDDEFLVVIVIVDFQLVVVVILVFIIGRPTAAGLPAAGGLATTGLVAETAPRPAGIASFSSSGDAGSAAGLSSPEGGLGGLGAWTP